MMEIVLFHRHLLATIAYRFQVAVRESPGDFDSFQAGKDVMTPRELVDHVGALVWRSHQLLSAAMAGERPKPSTWDAAIDAVHAELKKLDDLFENQKVFDEQQLLTVLQGPLADALTHIGQIATLRRLAGKPVARGNFMKAPIGAGKVAREQFIESLDQ